jgi:glycosyltransferase involved in cell wall biosynthesis
MTKISFIFPCYNESKYIGETLDQFAPFRQKYNLELVVANGKSQDDTVKVAQKHRADKIVVRRDEDPTTISFGRNNGGKAASGDILVWLDADIRIENVEKFINRVLELFKDPEIVAATANIYIYPQEETVLDRIFHWIVNMILRSSYLLGTAHAKGECQIIRAKTWKELGGYDSSLVVAEDIDMFRRLKNKGKVVFLKEINLFESPRRYRKLGHFRIVFEWLANYFSFVFFRKSYSKEWKAIR